MPSLSAAVAGLVRCAREATAPPSCATKIVAIDGLGGAGKSSLAAIVARELGGVPVVQTDDFATHDDSFGWGPRFLACVLEPLARGDPAFYRPYLWSERRLGDPIVAPGGGVVLIEGVSCSRAAFRPYLACIVWVDTPRPVRLTRGLLRDGVAAAEFWPGWMAAEDRWVAEEHPREHAHLVIDGMMPYLEGTEEGSRAGLGSANR